MTQETSRSQMVSHLAGTNHLDLVSHFKIRGH